ncbi:MAG: SCO family protein [Jatrophihabitantaceae bacterium]
MAAIALATTALLTSCASHSGGAAPSVSSAGIRGDQLSRPVPLSAQAHAAVFASTGGGTSTLGQLQSGKLMLLYFGYTHCPDVCPTTMADLGQALRQLPSIDQAHTQVVFVTSDPARDSPAVMKTWLSNFDDNLILPFVGLTATLKQIDTVATSVGVPLNPPVKEADGTISVEHGAQTLAFVNGKASVLWLAGTTVGDYAHDIATLLTRVGTT